MDLFGVKVVEVRVAYCGTKFWKEMAISAGHSDVTTSVMDDFLIQPAQQFDVTASEMDAFFLSSFLDYYIIYFKRVARDLALS